MNMIVLYSTHCPRCNVLEKKLNNKKIKYDIIDDENEIIKLGIDIVPMLKVNDELMNFGQAVKWVNGQE